MEGEKFQENCKPEPAESFQIDFLNSRKTGIENAMYEMGGFKFRSSGPLGDDSVYYEGEASDGTKIRLEIKKGQNYKSPKELVDERKLEQEKLKGFFSKK